MRNTLSAAALVLTLSACAHPSSFATASAYDPNLITFDQLASVRTQSAYDAIRKVRPSFFMSRGAVTILGSASASPIVYIDGMRFGTIEMLRQIPAISIAEVRVDRTTGASNLGHSEMTGVIRITTRRE
ncbi:MAG TPA: hypothetical protein VF042_14980 [Gemmatimonadaceae bacterium]